jgi:heme-binding protein
MRRWLLILAGIVLAMQLVPVPRTNGPAAEDIGAPAPVAEVMRRACHDCHSQATVWPWYGYVAPVSWLLAYDVTEARDHMDLSTWSALPARKRAKRLDHIAEEVEDREMPPAIYRLMHPEARLDDASRAMLVEWARSAAAATAPPAR